VVESRSWRRLGGAALRRGERRRNMCIRLSRLRYNWSFLVPSSYTANDMHYCINRATQSFFKQMEFELYLMKHVYWGYIFSRPIHNSYKGPGGPGGWGGYRAQRHASGVFFTCSLEREIIRPQLLELPLESVYLSNCGMFQKIFR
jgi:hypothetical protein